MSEGGYNPNGRACQREDTIQMEEPVRGRIQSKWKSMSDGGQYFLENGQQSNTNIITFYLFYTPKIIIDD